MLFCGIDIGTTNTKGILVNEQGTVLDTVKIPVKNQDTTNPQLWVNHFEQAISRLSAISNKSKIICSIASQGGSFIFLDSTNQPISSPLLWTQLADSKIETLLIDRFGSMDFYHKTGWNPNKWLACCKIHQEISRNNLAPKYIAFVPEFIHSWFCGKFNADITNAQITGLCDFANCRWDNDLCNWSNITPANLPQILSKPDVFAENIKIADTTISLSTSIHDQYAAMTAIDIKPNTEIMLATGTAWVINARTSMPVFDDTNFIMHPGRDISSNCYGNIITLGPIGQRFETLLNQLGICLNDFSAIEAEFDLKNIPSEALEYKVWGDNPIFSPIDDKQIKLLRFMQWSASCAAYYIDILSEKYPVEKIVMTGGASSSRVLPQLIAEICNCKVEVLEFDYLTAFGAVNIAFKAALELDKSMPLPPIAKKKLYTPQNINYRNWYKTIQRQVF